MPAKTYPGAKRKLHTAPANQAQDKVKKEEKARPNKRRNFNAGKTNTPGIATFHPRQGIKVKEKNREGRKRINYATQTPPLKKKNKTRKNPIHEQV